MVCPHCSTVVKFEWSISTIREIDNVKLEGKQVFFGECPNCEKLVVGIEHGKISNGLLSLNMMEMLWQKIVYPKTSNFQDSKDIPSQ